MRSETVGKRVSVGRRASDLVGSLVNRLRIAAKDRAEAGERHKAALAGPSVQERQEELAHFYNKYEDLVEVLCDAAQFGPTPKAEHSYAELRSWVSGNYAGVKPFVGAYLRGAASELPDDFEALIAANDLQEFLDMDDGAVITRITRTREALNLYAEHLRQLAARIG